LEAAPRGQAAAEGRSGLENDEATYHGRSACVWKPLCSDGGYATVRLDRDRQLVCLRVGDGIEPRAG
jgi:hypothetical protein